MKPIPLHSRSDLLKVLAMYAPTQACKQAILENRFSVLGGFTPAKGLPFVAVVVFGKATSWHLHLEIDEARYCYSLTRHLVPPDWADWAGQTTRGHEVWEGDTPVRNSLLRLDAKHARTTNDKSTPDL